MFNNKTVFIKKKQKKTLFDLNEQDQIFEKKLKTTLVETAGSFCMYFNAATNFHYDFLKLLRKLSSENNSLLYSTNFYQAASKTHQFPSNITKFG